MAMQYMPYLGLLVGNCQDVAVGDIVVLIRSEASMAQYGKWSVVDVFDGPFEVLELDPSIDQEGLMARISDPVTTQECFKAVEELRQCKVKLSIPANSKKSSWVRLGNLLPVLDASVVLRGRVEASSLYISELKAFKAYAKRLRSTSDGVTNTFKKLTLEALAGDEPPENVFGVVQLAICRFAVVLGPIDGTNDDHIERVRGKILQLVHKKSDIAVDENDLASDDDTWLKLLKKV